MHSVTERARVDNAFPQAEAFLAKAGAVILPGLARTVPASLPVSLLRGRRVARARAAR